MVSRTQRMARRFFSLDIEGFEIEALRGAREGNQPALRPTHRESEMHPNVWNSSNASRPEAELLLSELRLPPGAIERHLRSD